MISKYLGDTELKGPYQKETTAGKLLLEHNLYRACEQCESKNIEEQGCHYICLNCGNQEGCSD